LDKFLDTYNQGKLNQEDINHLKKSITNNVIEAVIMGLPTKKNPGPHVLMTESYQTFKEELIQYQFFQEIEREGTLSHSFYGASITLIQKPNKDATKRRITNQYL
jgi:hypothetical protein